MKIKPIKFSKNEIIIGENKILLDFPVETALILEGKIIVLFDPDSLIEKFGQFQNLIAINFDGNLIWKAELPTTTNGDCYYKVIIEKEYLIALSICSFQCSIDVSNGKIIKQTFYK